MTNRISGDDRWVLTYHFRSSDGPGDQIAKVYDCREDAVAELIFVVDFYGHSTGAELRHNDELVMTHEQVRILE